MKILVDALNFELPHGTGIKTYSRNVISALSHHGHSVDLLSEKSIATIKSVSPIASYLAAISSNSTGRTNLSSRIISKLHGRNHSGIVGLREVEIRHLLAITQTKEWECIDQMRVFPGLFVKSFIRSGLGLGVSTIPKSSNADALFLTSPIPVYLSRGLNILTVHDIIPLTHPWLLDRWTTIAKAIGSTLEGLFKKVDKVICVSETTRQQLLSRFTVDERKLHVVYQPCKFSNMGETWDELTEHNILEGLGLTNEPYVLFVGAIEPKKNVLNLLNAFKFNNRLPKLVLVGPFAWSSEKERALITSMPEKVRHLGYLTDNELYVLQKHAKTFVFPSIVEGFGLPVVEAMWQGVPCVVSDIPVFRELFHNYAVFVDPYDSWSISEGITSAINSDCIDRDAMIEFVRKKFSFKSFSESLKNTVCA